MTSSPDDRFHQVAMPPQLEEEEGERIPLADLMQSLEDSDTPIPIELVRTPTVAEHFATMKEGESTAVSGWRFTIRDGQAECDGPAE